MLVVVSELLVKMVLNYRIFFPITLINYHNP